MPHKNNCFWVVGGLIGKEIPIPASKPIDFVEHEQGKLLYLKSLHLYVVRFYLMPEIIICFWVVGGLIGKPLPIPASKPIDFVEHQRG